MTNPANASETPQKIAAELPESYSTRWSASRKAAVVRGVQSGVISLSKALAKYRLSRHEFRSWQQHFETDGIKGLRARDLVLNR